MPFDAALGGKGSDRVTGQFGSVARDNHARPATPINQATQFSGNTPPRDRGVRDCCKAFPGHVIDHVQDAEPSPAGKLAVDEVERPTGVGPRFNQDQGTRADCLARARLMSLTIFSPGLSVVVLIVHSSVVTMSQEFSLIKYRYLDP